jgi:hypothetical protein
MKWPATRVIKPPVQQIREGFLFAYFGLAVVAYFDKHAGLQMTTLPRMAGAAITAALLFTTNLIPAAQARTWTDDLRRSWDGDFVRIEGDKVIILVKGKEYPFPLDRLSAGDRQWIVAQRAQALTTSQVAIPAVTPTGPIPAAASGSKMTFGSVQLEVGKTVQTDLPLPPKIAKEQEEAYGKPTTIMKAAIAVPNGFDPSKPQRVLITSASSTGDGLSIKNMASYTEAALARGWVVMAADGEFGKGSKSDGIYFRGNMLEVMTKELETRWPDAKAKWSFATGGFSGGAGFASNQAMLLAGDGWNVIGMFLANSAYGPYAWERDKRTKGSKSKFQKIPIFVSAGETDNVQKPDTIKQALENMKSGGYKTVKAEWHPGAHQMSKEHLTAALDWFESQAK